MVGVVIDYGLTEHRCPRFRC